MQNTQRRTYQLQSTTVSGDETHEYYLFHTQGQHSSESILWINGAELATVQLKTYTGEVIQILGEIHMTVQYKSQERKLNFLVVAGEGPSLLAQLSLVELEPTEFPTYTTAKITASCQVLNNAVSVLVVIHMFV